MDTDALISSVYVRTPIWDKRNKLHANRNVIGTIWKDIAKEIQCEETVLRKKWKYLREKFASEYNKRPVSRSGDAAGSCPPSKWPYFQQLMFLKDIVQTRASSIVPPAGIDPAEDVDNDVDIDDAVSQCSQDSLMTSVSIQIEEAVGSPQATQENVTEDTPQFLEGASPSLQTPVSSKRKRKSQEDYYQRMCTVEERKLEFLLDKLAQEKPDPDREDVDLMFLKTLLPHIRKIPQHMKLRFHSRIQRVVQKFAYGPHQSQPDTAIRPGYSTYSTTPSSVDPLNTSHSPSRTPSTSFD